MASDQEQQDRSTLQLALNESLKWLSSLDQRSVATTLSLTQLRQRLKRPLDKMGIPAEKVIQDLVADAEGGLLGTSSGRFYAWVIGGSLPSALAADWLTSAWNQNAGMSACAPAASVIEEVAGEWILELFDLPRHSSFAFTTGCQMAHFTCLAAARLAILKKVGWDLNQQGLFGAPPIQLLTSDHRHSSIDRAAKFLGFGSQSIITLPTNNQGKLTSTALKSALKIDGPKILVLNAADLNIGAFDDFSELIPLAHEAGAWVHIDGAFGLFARASQSKQSLAKGAELADSWATDAHKWLNVPYDCGIAIVKDQSAHRESMTVSASYLFPNKEARDEIDWNPEYSRRARAIPVYAALRELGKEGVEDLIDRCCQLCQLLVDELGKLKGVEVLWRLNFNQGLVRFLDPKPGASDQDHELRTEKVIAAVNQSGEAYFASSTWQGKRAMRVSLVNWRTTEEDVLRAVAAVRAALQG